MSQTRKDWSAVLHASIVFFELPFRAGFAAFREVGDFCDKKPQVDCLNFPHVDRLQSSLSNSSSFFLQSSLSNSEYFLNYLPSLIIIKMQEALSMPRPHFWKLPRAHFFHNFFSRLNWLAKKISCHAAKQVTPTLLNNFGSFCHFIFQYLSIS